MAVNTERDETDGSKESSIGTAFVRRGIVYRYYNCTALEVCGCDKKLKRTIISSPIIHDGRIRIVDRVSDHAFLNSTLLENVEFLDGIRIRRFGAEVFKGCTSLKSVSLFDAEDIYTNGGNTTVSDTMSYSVIQKKSITGCNATLLVIGDKNRAEYFSGWRGFSNVVFSEPDNITHCWFPPQPSFPGDRDSLFSFISRNARYPVVDGARVQGEGASHTVRRSSFLRVIVKFNIDVDGRVINAKIMKSVSPEFDAEALRIVYILPKWTPAMDYDEPIVSLPFFFPITFMKKAVKE